MPFRTSIILRASRAERPEESGPRRGPEEPHGGARRAPARARRRGQAALRLRPRRPEGADARVRQGSAAGGRPRRLTVSERLRDERAQARRGGIPPAPLRCRGGARDAGARLRRREGGDLPPAARLRRRPAPRSEEHTSELQSRENLVCRLLLEKKKKKKKKLINIKIKKNTNQNR